MPINRLLTVVLVWFCVCACKEKKKELSGAEPIEFTDFAGFFPDLKLPFQFADSNLLTKSADSLRISKKIFNQFFPDSVLLQSFGKSSPQLYPLGKLEVKDGETYLLLKAVGAGKRLALLAVFNEDKFVTAMPVISGTNAKSTTRSVLNIDSRYTITLLRQKAGEEGQMVYNKNVYVYNTAGVFTLILTESNDQDNTDIPIINPIDTLAKLNKWAGDYLQDKRNFLSFRDGRKAATLQFFVHFEKDGGDCKGELKGDAVLDKSNQARFTESNGPCSIEFSFTGNTVRMKEIEGCGAYRDIKCFFEGTYTRKKKAAVKPAKKKK